VATSEAASADDPKATVARVDPATITCPVPEPTQRATFERAVELLGSIETPRIDTVWILGQVGERHSELHLDDPLDGRRVSEPSDPALRLVDPTATPAAPRVSGSDANARLIRDMGAVFGPPGPATTAAVDRFTGLADQHGYVLAHQWLVLLWADDLGLELPVAITDRAAGLEAAVRAELRDHPDLPLDLWAELTALLVNHGRATTDAERASAACRAVGTVSADGAWRGDGTYRQEYDGGAFDIVAEPEHVTSLMTWLLSGVVPAS
jgi:hypothetical protein